MDILDTIHNSLDAVTVRRVYGDAVEIDGVTVIPAAAVRGGAGGGGGTDAGTGSAGSGGGYGVEARPVGAFVIKDGVVRWKPAVDVNAIVFRSLATFAGVSFFAYRALKASKSRR